MGTPSQTKAKLALVCPLHLLASCMTETRTARLAELKAQLQVLSEEGRGHGAGLTGAGGRAETVGPIHAAVLALADELRGE
jgi:hypothetical protein